MRRGRLTLRALLTPGALRERPLPAMHHAQRGRRLCLALWCLLMTGGVGVPAWAGVLDEGLRAWISGRSTEPLPPGEAFRVSVAPDASAAGIHVRWDIEEGYYLYRDALAVSFADDAPVRLAAYTLPAGVVKADPAFGEVEVYYHNLDLRVPLATPASTPLQALLHLEYRGCKENSVCYPLIRRTLPVSFAGADSVGPLPAVADTGVAGRAAPPAAAGFKPGDPEPLGLLLAGNTWAALGGFFLLGLLLAFTPCVFPMLPILSAMLAGGRGISTSRAFALTLVYVLTIAGSYAVLGLVAGLVGLNLQVAAQSAWVIVPFSLVLALLALAMFGVYELQWPRALRERLAVTALPGGTWSGAALLGVASAVLAGPCVAPPVLAAMLYIGRTGDGAFGALSLFSMGLGFGVPLLIFGTSLGHLLPRAGAWMLRIRHLLGVLILAVAIAFLDRVLPGPLMLLAWGALAIGCALYLGALGPAVSTRYTLPGRAAGLVLLVYGAALVIGAAAGGADPLRPLQHYGTAARQGPGSAPTFHTVYNLEELSQQLRWAGQAQRPVLVDFYAEWCVECKRLGRTFSAPEVRGILAEAVLVKVDVSHDTPAARALLARFELYGPPAVLFFGSDMRERRVYRLYEYAAPAEFAHRARRAFAS